MNLQFTPRLCQVWQRGYSARSFSQDFFAGLTVAVVALPLAIAFAIASGLTPMAGLTAAIIGGFIVSSLGGSSVQIGGPAGAFIVVVYGIVERYGVANLFICTLMAGVLLFLMGLFRLGALVRLIPVTVVIGFTNGIAVLIAVSQIKDFFGLQITKMPSDFFEQLLALWSARHSFNFSSLMMASLSLLVLFAWPKAFKTEHPQDWRKYLAHLPAPLIVLVLATLASLCWQLSVDTLGSRFGHLPNHLPSPMLPTFHWVSVKTLFVPALTLALLSAMSSLLCARVADALAKDRHDPNQELMAQGIANVVVPWFGGLPVAGTVARTVTNIRAGAVSPIAGLLHAITLLIVLSFAAPLAEHIPLAVLASILIFVAWNMGEWHEFSRLKVFSMHYRIIVITTFLLTVIFDLTIAVEMGLALACLFFITRVVSLTHVEQLNLPHTPEDMVVFRIHGSIFFASAGKLETLQQDIGTARTVVLDLSTTLNVDTTGIEALQNLHQNLHKEKIRLLLCGANTQVMSLMRRTGFSQMMGENNLFASLDEALPNPTH